MPENHQPSPAYGVVEAVNTILQQAVFCKVGCGAGEEGARGYPIRLGFVLDCYFVPTVLRFDGLRVVIYLNDHRPEHVHVIGGGGEAVFLLRCPGGPTEIRENYGFSRREVAKIEAELAGHIASLCAEWGRIHG